MNYSASFRKIITNNVAIFFVMVISGMLLGVFIKGENLTDLINYHYYLGYNFFTENLDNHLAIGGPNGFLNPLLDTLTYLYIKYFNDYPNVIFALQGIWYGLSLFFLFKIMTLFVDVTSTKGLVFILFCLILATTRQAIWIQIGTSTNEMPMLCFDLCGLYILLKTIQTQQQQNFKNFIYAGFIMGTALGLKSTSAHVCISTGLMLIFMRKSLNLNFKSIALFAVSGLIGYILINGLFMYKLWNLYGNPFFPFLNHIFKSEYAAPIPYQDTYMTFKFYFPFLPYFFYFVHQAMKSVKLIDHFFIFSYTILMFYMLLLAWKYYKKKIKASENLINALAVFLILDWFIGMYMFGVLRYFVVYCVLTAFFIPYLAFSYYQKYNSKIALACLLLLSLFVLGQNLRYRGVNYRKNLTQFFAIERINIPKNALVKFYGTRTSFLIPLLAKNSTFKSVVYHHLCINKRSCGFFGMGEDFVEKYKFRENREKIVKAHTGPVIYFFYPKEVFFHKKDYNKENYDAEYEMDFDDEKNLIDQAFALKRISPEKYWNLTGEMEFKKMKIYKDMAKEIQDNYFCREIKINLPIPIDICVPKELKQQILEEEPQGEML